jgi:hypothetical protein
MGLKAVDLCGNGGSVDCAMVFSVEVGRAYLDSLGIKFQAFLLVGEELLNILALISLELNHLPHLSVDDDGAIASYGKG